VAGFVGLQRHRAQLRHLESIEEFVQLRNWPMAAVAVEGLLREPPRTAAVRVQALIFLANVLARYHRFTDAIAVQNHLLETVPMDAGTDYGLRIGRVMAMLREDHLFDADRAISALRRLGDRADSAGLGLIELYRDVKTGHPAEAIETFEQRLAIMRDKLGHRVADAHALAARAYDLLDRTEEARAAWARATTLAPAIELTRRYPEIERTAAKFSPTVAPVGM
jgi:tetratricopeptide (TPR) repeat protein